MRAEGARDPRCRPMRLYTELAHQWRKVAEHIERGQTGVQLDVDVAATEGARAPHLRKRPQIDSSLERSAPDGFQRSPLLRFTGEIVAGAKPKPNRASMSSARRAKARGKPDEPADVDGQR